jgi:hypothetical protein
VSGKLVLDRRVEVHLHRAGDAGNHVAVHQRVQRVQVVDCVVADDLRFHAVTVLVRSQAVAQHAVVAANVWHLAIRACGCQLSFGQHQPSGLGDLRRHPHQCYQHCRRREYRHLLLHRVPPPQAS